MRSMPMHCQEPSLKTAHAGCIPRTVRKVPLSPWLDVFDVVCNNSYLFVCVVCRRQQWRSGWILLSARSQRQKQTCNVPQQSPRTCLSRDDFVQWKKRDIPLSASCDFLVRKGTCRFLPILRHLRREHVRGWTVYTHKWGLSFFSFFFFFFFFLLFLQVCRFALRILALKATKLETYFDVGFGQRLGYNSMDSKWGDTSRLYFSTICGFTSGICEVWFVCFSSSNSSWITKEYNEGVPGFRSKVFVCVCVCCDECPVDDESAMT